VILTVDIGTSVTKVALWDRTGMVARAARPLDIVHPAPGWTEQDPSAWWASVVEACRDISQSAPDGWASVEAVACTGARQTLALVDGTGDPLGSAIVWSDRRAGAEADGLARRWGSSQRPRTGVPPDAGSMAAKVAWLAAHDGDRLAAATWILAPRDVVAFRLTGRAATDPTMASSTGLYHFDGRVVDELAGPAAGRLAPVFPSDQVTGALTSEAADALGLAAGTPVVIGAGDRACEVLGVGATSSIPMVSWGTTANVSVPSPIRPLDVPPGVMVSRAADGGWLFEGGLSGAGSFLAWLGQLTGHSVADLAELATGSPVGARGVTATPWLDGARAPWWRPEAGAAFVGLSSAHGLPDLARAVFESVAWEVQRCLEAIANRRPAGPSVEGLALTGSGAAVPVWIEVLGGVTGRPVTGRRSGQAAGMGAALLAASALGLEWDVDMADPVEVTSAPDPTDVGRYAALRPATDRVAGAVIGMTDPAPPAPAVGGDPCG
jgi:sugar (pentulose or hexulose) kinase